MNHVADKFRLAAPVLSISPFGSGHINASFRVTTHSGNYLLQRINQHVFPDVASLTENIRQVTDHLRSKISAASGEAGLQRTVQLVPTISGALWHQDAAGNYWRVFDFLDGLVSYDLVETPEQAYAGARSFGFFLGFLADFPADRLVSVLPDFHNIISRLTAFERARYRVPLPLVGITHHPKYDARSQVQGKLAERVHQCKPEIQQVQALANELTEIQRAWEQGKLPTRVTHNDTKFNNVLLTPQGQGRAVIDLDTVMPGIVHFDFGDGIRTGAATAAEDEADLSLVGVDHAKHQAFTEGYLSVTRDFLTPAELHYLPRAGALLAFIMGVRFLTDYLSGDVYYTIKHPEHNLVRARNQLRLAEVLRGSW